jgi:hypothetical protein
MALIGFLVVWSLACLLLAADYRGWLTLFWERSSPWSGGSIFLYRLGFTIGFSVGALGLLTELAGIGLGRVG